MPLPVHPSDLPVLPTGSLRPTHSAPVGNRRQVFFQAATAHFAVALTRTVSQAERLARNSVGLRFIQRSPIAGPGLPHHRHSITRGSRIVLICAVGLLYALWRVI